MRLLRRQLLTGLLATVCLIVLLGVVYPLAVTGVSAVVFGGRATGSLVSARGRVVGSSLIGQSFTDSAGKPLPQYFQPRPSFGNYSTAASGGSNLGPSSDVLVRSVAARVAAYRSFNGLAASAPVPIDAVTASGSGLDPDISEANALDQAPRVAAARGLDLARVVALVRAHVDGRPWGFLGDPAVNVLDLNLALDKLS